jgi:hypothetical protein
MSADGSRLLAQNTRVYDLRYPDRTLRMYSLPSRTVIAEWPATYTQPNDPQPIDFDMSADGDVIGQRIYLNSGTSADRRVFHLDGTPIWSDSITASSVYSAGLVISKSGTHFAAASASQTPGTVTNIYANGVLSSAGTGEVVGWLDETRLLVRMYTIDNHGFDVLDGSKIINTSGQTETAEAFGALPFQVAGPNLTYTPDNVILDVLTGEKVWSTPAPGDYGAVNSGYVIFPSGHTLRIEPR